MAFHVHTPAARVHAAARLLHRLRGTQCNCRRSSRPWIVQQRDKAVAAAAATASELSTQIQGEDEGTPLGWQLTPELQLMQQSITVGGTQYPLVVPTDIYQVMEYYLERGEQGLDPYWARPWPSGAALASELLGRPGLAGGLRVAEVGAGLGMAGLAAAAAGAASVVLMDREPLGLTCALLSAAGWGVWLPPEAPHPLLGSLQPLALELAQRAQREGRSPAQGPGASPAQLATALVDWHDPPAGATFDVVLACDVLYEKESVEPVARLCQSLLAPGGRLLLADPPNRTRENRERFLSLLRDSGQSYVIEEVLTRHVASGTKPAEVALVNIRRAIGNDTVGVKRL